jgi:hypothetical protein
MKSLLRLMPILVVLALLLSCSGGGRGDSIIEAHSMEEALGLASENSAFVAVEFWIDG